MKVISAIFKHFKIPHLVKGIHVYLLRYTYWQIQNHTEPYVGQYFKCCGYL